MGLQNSLPIETQHEESLAEEESIHEHVVEWREFRRQLNSGSGCGANQAIRCHRDDRREQ